jgi:hypothetical protein
MKKISMIISVISNKLTKLAPMKMPDIPAIFEIKSNSSVFGNSVIDVYLKLSK